MSGRVVVINGGSSSGKSRIARELQDLLPDPWLSLSVDTFVEALPRRLIDGGAGIHVGAEGEVGIGESFTELENLWMHGVGSMARAGARIVVDDSFLAGAESQARWRRALVDVAVLWVGVRCDPEVAEARERARGDRVPGMARRQALLVHHGVDYDLEVDTTSATPRQSAGRIAAALGSRGGLLTEA